MGQKGYEKTQEEILRERAEILFRAGEKLADAIRTLSTIELHIEFLMRRIREPGESDTSVEQARIRSTVNAEIERYNDAREYAKLRHYYLIVTREAMGFRRHTWVDEIYRIPVKKRPLRDTDGQVQESKTQDG